MRTQDIHKFVVSGIASIRQSIECLNMNSKGIVLVTDDDMRLIGTITDGDIRRAVMAGTNLEEHVTVLLERKSATRYSQSITARADASDDLLLELMQKNAIRQVPLVDAEGRVTGLVTWEDLLPKDELPLKAIILAGGRASRLHPLADDLPRPMLPIGNHPLMELTITQMRQAGIQNINLTTHYKPESIIKHFGNGEQFGVHLNYINESQPMGTAGALGLLPLLNQPILVVNGDVLTRVDYRAMLDFHLEQQADLTVAVRMHNFQIPYGVVESNGASVLHITEKPVKQYFINAGIYLINPEILAYIPSDQPYDMPDLINRLLSEGKQVANFPIHEYWLDIQEYHDYQQVLADAQNGLFQDIEQATLQFEPGTPAPPGFIPLCVPEISGNEWSYIKECLDTNWVSSVGPFVDQFEEILARYTGTKFGVAASSGTAALHTALLVAGVQRDDEVLISTLTFIAPANAVRYVGAWPVFVDVEPDHWQMDPQRVVDFLDNDCYWRNGGLYNRASGRRVKAIIPVHILGHPCDMEPILAIARKYGLVVIEDATESLGAKYKGQMVGKLGDIACFSFNGNKIITTGGGGMLVTDNEAWARKAKYLTTQAKDDPIEYIHNEIGYNYRLTNIQAAMGCAQMEKLPAYMQAKNRIASFYRENLAGVPGLQYYQAADWAKCTFWLSSVRVQPEIFGMDCRALMKALSKQGIQSRPLWHTLHDLQLFSNCHSLGGEIAGQLYRDVLSLPSSVGLSEADLQRVIQSVCDIREILNLEENEKYQS